MAAQRTIIDAARHYIAAGLAVVPIVRWSKDLDREALEADIPEGLPTEAHLQRWFGDTRCRQIGIFTGRFSGGVCCLDFDDTECYLRWRNAPFAVPDSLLRSLPTVRTHRGMHVYLRLTDPPATRLLTPITCYAIELRATGGHVLVPPSRHPEGSLYQHISGCPLTETPLLTSDQAADLIDHARRIQIPAPQPTSSWREDDSDAGQRLKNIADTMFED